MEEDWTSVEDELPEIGVEVNVITHTGKVTSLVRYIRYEGDSTYYWDNDNGQGNMYLPGGITHWRHLPKGLKR